MFDGRQNHSGIQPQTSPHAAHSHSLPANRRDNDLLQGMCATNIILNGTSYGYQAKLEAAWVYRAPIFGRVLKAGSEFVCGREVSVFSPGQSFWEGFQTRRSGDGRRGRRNLRPSWEHCMWQNIFPHYSWGLILVLTHSIHKNTYWGTLYIHRQKITTITDT